MFWLIKKELTANLRYMLLGFLFFLVYAFIFTGNGSGLFMLCLTICVYSILSTNLVLDERYRIDLLLTTLPVKRRDLVISKYCTVLVLFVLCAVLYVLLSLAAGLMGFDRIPPLTWPDAMLGLFAVSVYIGITLPLNYRFGAQSTRYVSLLLFFAVFLLSSLVPGGAIRIAEAGLTAGQTGFLFLIGALVVNAASFLLSSAIFSKKDL